MGCARNDKTGNSKSFVRMMFVLTRLRIRLCPIRRRRIRRWFDDHTRAIGTRHVAISRKVTHHGEIARRVSGRDAFAI